MVIYEILKNGNEKEIAVYASVEEALAVVLENVPGTVRCGLNCFWVDRTDGLTFKIGV